MPLIPGIGNEVLCGALVAASPLLLLWHSAARAPLRCVQAGFSFLRQLAAGAWTHAGGMLGRGGRPADSGAQARPAEAVRGAGVDQPPEGDICPVCHDTFSVACQANCSHWFCGPCILRVWEHSSVLSPCRCPICRRPITLLIPSQAGSTQPVGAEEARGVLRSVGNYNRLFGGGPVSIWQRVRDMPLLLRRLAWELSDPQRALRLLHNARIAFLLVLVLLYVLSPFDFIPESVLGLLGLLDDLLLLVVVAYHLSILYRATLLAGNYAPSGAGTPLRE